MLPQNLDRFQQQIVEIHGRGFVQYLVVRAKNLGDVLPLAVLHLRRLRFHFIRRDAVIFRVADLRAHAARRVILGGKIELDERALHRRHLIVVIVNREIAGQPSVPRLAPQQPRAEGMKRRDPNVRTVAPARAQQIADALLHHARGFVRERHREDRAGRHALFDQLRHAIRDHARLARSRARENEHGPFGCEHSFALLRVESVEECHCVRGIAQARIVSDEHRFGNLRSAPSVRAFTFAGRFCKLCYNHTPSFGTIRAWITSSCRTGSLKSSR